MKQIVLDYETRSTADLKKIGGYEYARHPSTEILCAGYKIDGGPVQLWTPGDGGLPEDFVEAAENPGVVWIAHNALFEQCITGLVLRRKRFFFPELPPHRWKCTAAKAAAYALPRNLEGACLALDLPVKKNMDGRRLMLKHSKPRTSWKAWNEGGRIGPEPQKWHINDFELWAIHDYCKTDVEAEYLLDRALPDLIPSEQKVWLLNQKMNLRGVQVDTETSKIILGLIAIQTGEMEQELCDLTGGEVSTVGQRDKMLEWLRTQGVPMNGLAVKEVEETLNAMQDLDMGESLARKVLEIRKALSKSSTKKYKALLARAGSDGRVRDLSLYHGAHTGRESGTGLQLQNLPKGTVKNTSEAIEVIRRHRCPEFVKALYGDPMSVYASCVRGMITASPEHKLFVADYNAIEARGLAWLAGDENALENFRNHIDPYVEMAMDIFGLERADITDALRFIGKIAELGLGYQMGAAKFFQTCVNWGAKDMTMDIAELAVEKYRKKHLPISKLWPQVERAAIEAVRNPESVIKLSRLALGCTHDSLWIQLPSGRRIHYHAPEVRLEPTPWGDVRPKLYYMSVDSLTKKWVSTASYGGLLTENICQALCRDITMHAADNAERQGYLYLSQIHDEVICEAKTGSVKEFENILTDLPEWADGLPVVAKGWSDFRYRKG